MPRYEQSQLSCLCGLNLHNFQIEYIHIVVSIHMLWGLCVLLSGQRGKKSKKSFALVCHCLSVIGWRVWKWNVILGVKHQTASSCWAVRSSPGQRMGHGLVCARCLLLYTQGGMGLCLYLISIQSMDLVHVFFCTTSMLRLDAKLAVAEEEENGGSHCFWSG